MKKKNLNKLLISHAVFLITLFPTITRSADKTTPNNGSGIVVAVDTTNGTLAPEINQKIISEGHVVRFIKSPITPDQLRNVAALLVCAPFAGNGSPPAEGVEHHSLYRLSEIKAIVDFVVEGGTFIGAGQVWSWESYGAKPAKDHPLNQIGTGLGFKIEGSIAPHRFLESPITKEPKNFKLDTSGIYSVVDVGRSFREKIIISTEKELCAAGARRAKGFIYIFGHELAIMENPEIIENIIMLRAPQRVSKAAASQKTEKREKSATEAVEPGIVIAPEQDPLEVLATNAPNIISWLASPLDTIIPKELPKNITFIREDILDAGSNDPENKQLYDSAAVLCNAMISAVGHRERRQAEAKLEVAKAKADSPLSNQALNARRNYQMSWPQYEREVQQRSVLEKKRAAAEELEFKAEEAKWANKAIFIRQKLDQLFQDFRTKKRQKTTSN